MNAVSACAAAARPPIPSLLGRFNGLNGERLPERDALAIYAHTDMAQGGGHRAERKRRRTQAQSHADDAEIKIGKGRGGMGGFHVGSC